MAIPLHDGAASGSNGAVAGASPGPPPSAKPSDASPFGVLENGVRTAYAVIEEYMRRGQEAARNMYGEADTRGAMNDNRANYGAGFNPGGPFAMMGEQWMNMMRAWTNCWSAFAVGGVPQPWAASAYPGAPAASVTAQVSSQYPVKVTALLTPGMEYAELTVQPLQPEGFTAAPISGVTVCAEGRHVRVSVSVPSGQKAGCYRGAITRRADGCLAGSVIVDVAKP